MGTIARRMTDPARSTTTLLLDGLFDLRNEQAWGEFLARYQPIVLALMRKMGMDEDDAADVAQQTLMQFVRDYRAGRYNRGKGRLRSWILAIARNRAIDLCREHTRRRERHGDSKLDQLPGEEELSTLWDEEVRAALFDRAMNELRNDRNLHENTLRVFQLNVIESQPAEAVAAECDVTVAEVYRIKHRVTVLLREIVERLAPLYEEDEAPAPP